MNRTYRLVWSTRNNAFVPVAEMMPARGKRSRSGASLAPAAWMLASTLAGAVAYAQPPPAPAHSMSVPSSSSPRAPGSASAPPPLTLPSGGQVVAGQSTITRHGSTLDITQSTQKSIIDWQTFNVGAQAQVNFIQNNAAAVSLDRVVGGNLAQIEGRINANGQVFLVDPNGIIFGKGAQVNVGGLTASTLDITNADFLAGDLKFSRNGATGSIDNEGEITVIGHGTAALLSADITNAGIVSAQLGKVVMAAGEAVTLSFNGGSVSVQVDPAKVAALIDNQQLIEAAGGQVVMTARAANALLGASINNSGTLSASSLVSEGGTVKLVADTISNNGTIEANGTRGGTVSVQAVGEFDAFGAVSATGAAGVGGKIDVSAQRSVMIESASFTADGSTDGGQVNIALGTAGNGGGYYSGTLSASGTSGVGGSVQMTGLNIDLFGTQIDAHGATGGGTVLIGGDEHGGDAAVFNAQNTTVNEINIDVSATQDGTGGKAVVWSQESTGFTGSIDARGASHGVKSTATGGDVEVSSKNKLYFDGNVRAKSLLLDPATLSIINPGLGLTLTAFVDPDNASSGFGTAVYDLTNTSNMLVLSPNENAIGGGAGYVFQRNGTLVSALRDTGAVANWTSLGNDRYLVANQGADGGLGAVMYFNGDSPPASGSMSSTNSLIGNNYYGNGFGAISNLGGGYWAASMSTGGNDTAAYALTRGAWTFFQAGSSGTNLPTGTVGPSNSLVGTTAGVYGTPNAGNGYDPTSYGDAIGYMVVGGAVQNFNNGSQQIQYQQLVSDGNGDWLLGSSTWTDTANSHQYAGAITFISPARINSGALVGAVSASNSIIGTATDAEIALHLRQPGTPDCCANALTNYSGGDFILNLGSYGLVGITPTIASNGLTGSVSSA